MTVTGGAGFIGSNLVRLLLERGYRVTVLDDMSSGFRENLDGLAGVELIEASILEEEAVRQAVEDAAAVFHLAASVGGIGANREHQAEFFYDNLQTPAPTAGAVWAPN